uniref:Chondroitin proteoglycan 4 domain-containing protein n=1 Tax=Haemonchus contortus TaxID=6289 RepID=A0A7I4Y385_HAECO|nr:Hypothetical protein CBG13337 [Haemonchus contortus]
MSMQMMLALTFIAVVVDAGIMGQCQCDAYMKCVETHKPEMNFKDCMKTCKGVVGNKVPTEYPVCLHQFEHVLSNTMKCVHNGVGTGCTSNESNVLRRRNFTVFEEIFQKDFREIVEKVGVSFNNLTEPAKVMNRCLLGCFYPAQNTCTIKLGCGLFMPNELRLVDNMVKCALQNDVSKGIMMEIATCLRSVMQKPKDDDEEDDRDDKATEFTD